MNNINIENQYFSLQNFLGNWTENSILLSFRQIEIILGEALPEAAYKYQVWWVNSEISGSHASWWLDVGYEVTEVELGEFVNFRKI